MAARLPVVATDVGGVAEVVVRDITGLLAPAGDDEALARHLVHLVADRASAIRLGRNGAARAADLFSFNRMAAGYATVFAEVCGSTWSAVARHRPPSEVGSGFVVEQSFS